MNYKFLLLLITLLIIGLSGGGLYLSQPDDSISKVEATNFVLKESEKNNVTTTVNIESNIQTPDEEWEKQQQKKQINKQKVVITQKTELIKPVKSKLEINANAADVIIDNDNEILTPDEVWEQQYNLKRDYSIPATIPEIEVISEKQLEVEALARSQSNNTSTTENKKFTYGPGVDRLQPTNSGNRRFRVEPDVDVIPFGMQEAEALWKRNRNEISNDGFSEPLIDPRTGLSEQDQIVK